MRLRDAFTPSQPVSSTKQFAGRTAILDGLIRAIEDQRLHVVLYGERGIGKTSLLHVVSQLAEEAQYLVRYVSCGEESDFGTLMRSVVGTIPLLYHADYDPTDEEIEQGTSLDSLLPPGPVTANQVCDIFSRLSGTRLLIILDEFDRSPHGNFRRIIAELIKNLSDRSIRVQFVIAGVASNLAELVEHIPSVRRNVIGLRVPPMNAEETRELIAIGEEASGMPFNDKAADLITTIAKGSPYLASLLGQHAAIEAVERDAKEVDASDVAAGVRIAADEIEQRISERTVKAVKRAFAEGNSVDLGTIACLAMANGGRLETRGSGLASDNGRECERIVRDIALADDLVVPLGDPDEGVYEFREEGAPAYIWIRLTLTQIEEHGRPMITTG
ncbi:AAA family ATPase [Novosphingobium mangrovi (ex Huang et al. 2023)]|uniref:ATP-binding protein n=1 Tax=Novosphingobium mangrovi (ex Huang et al. 2023) TaxID=2976432 RepID=A0ABT2I0S8_9SPHN|nr:ATP-binding protein [Novosphingobium mangrovi (ex Huang et al. 2023)]MCT2398403.1 ATP-binding protein [Novosphingobium mangrovi (ex Huang et al. 2023)]